MAGEADELAPVAPEFFVPDVRASARFYADVLGFRIVRADATFAVLALGPAIVMLAPEGIYGEKISRRGGAVDIRFMVGEVDALYERLRRAGVEIVHPIGDRYYGLRDFIIRDLNGFRLRFAAPLR